MIGKSFLSDMLEGREKLDIELQKIIDKRTWEWASMSVRSRSAMC
ncbi:MAG: hypothetical protein WCB46_06175 [Methanoregula sp.]